VRVWGPAATVPQSREAGDSAQFPGEGTLIAGPTGAFEKQSLRCLRGVGRGFLQSELAFNAQQLGHTPAAFGALRAGEGLIDCNQSPSHSPSTTGGFCECTEERHQMPGVFGFTKLIECAAEMPQSGRDIAGQNGPKVRFTTAPIW
jgi:hypothetical protein